MGFQIPQLPTDSMYKFIAFAGLICIIVSLYGFFSIYKSAKKRLELLSDKAKDLDKNHRDELRALGVSDKPSPESPNLAQARQLMADHKENLESIIKEMKAIGDEPKKLNEAPILSTTFLIGIVIFIVGLYFWYDKRQRYEDIIIRGEAEKYLPLNTPLVDSGAVR